MSLIGTLRRSMFFVIVPLFALASAARAQQVTPPPARTDSARGAADSARASADSTRASADSARVDSAAARADRNRRAVSQPALIDLRDLTAALSGVVEPESLPPAEGVPVANPAPSAPPSPAAMAAAVARELEAADTAGPPGVRVLGRPVPALGARGAPVPAAPAIDTPRVQRVQAMDTARLVVLSGPGQPLTQVALATNGGSASAGSAAAAATAATGAPSSPVVLGRPVPGLVPDATRVSTAPAMTVGEVFLRDQLARARVKIARGSADAQLRAAFERAGVPYPGAQIYLRAFKREHELEVWGQKQDGTYALVRTLSVCSLGGSGLGPKLHRGDEQVPEGFYHVVDFNPASEYHLSLRLDYPNAADRARPGADGVNLGGDIYIHGGCRSAGCLPLTDKGIQEVYWVAVQARAAGQKQVPIDIFPARLDAARWTQLSQAFAKRKDLLAFWADLKLGYDIFERTRRVPDVAIDAAGRYRVALMAR